MPISNKFKKNEHYKKSFEFYRIRISFGTVLVELKNVYP